MTTEQLQFAQQLRESIESMTKELEKLPPKSFIGEYTNDKGEIVRYYQCHIDPDFLMPQTYLPMMIAQAEEILHDTEPLFEPNRIDSRRVRKELKDNMVNLGNKVNKIPNNAMRI